MATETEIFWSQLGAYNEVTFPVQAAMIFLAAILTYYVFAKPTGKANDLMKAFLSFVFAWNGIVFLLIFAKSSISTPFAPIFLAVAVLFAVDISTKKITFKLPKVTWLRYLTIFWILLVFLYPVIGFALGHHYPKTCLPMNPCPSTVFAIALVSAAIPKVDRKICVLLLPWALLSLPKCLGVFECYEDCILFLAGVYGLIMLIKNWKTIGKS
jgi:hypothetical protein